MLKKSLKQKETYVIPQIMVYEMEIEQSLLAGSDTEVDASADSFVYSGYGDVISLED
jgi:hypothetical protein